MAKVREEVIRRGGSPRFVGKGKKKKVATKGPPAPGEPTGRPRIGRKKPLGPPDPSKGSPKFVKGKELEPPKARDLAGGFLQYNIQRDLKRAAQMTAKAKKRRRAGAQDVLAKKRAKGGGDKLAFLGLGKKKAEAKTPPDKGKGKGFVGSAREKAKQARRKKLIAAGFSQAEAAEMEP